MSEQQIVSDEQIEEALAEEIDSQEVEKVTHALSDLMNQVEDETIYALLQEAYDCISALVDWEEDEEDTGEQAAAA